MHSYDIKNCGYDTRCKMSVGGGCGNDSSGPLQINTAGRYGSKLCCDTHSLATVTPNNYQAAPSTITKSTLGDGCYDVTLNDGTSGTYVKTSLQDITADSSATPIRPTECSFSGNKDKLVHKIPTNEVIGHGTTDLSKVEPRSEGAEMVGGAGMMRAGGRHHLVDIHGLAVFLRQSTRCLSCRASRCLYITGTISAHLAAVTQVKITCQKCHYTTSQALSRPAAASDEPGSPHPTSLQPTPPSDSQSPLQPTPSNDLHPSLSYIATIHQNSFKKPTEKQVPPVALPPTSKANGTTNQQALQNGPSNKLLSLLSLPPLQPLEEVCVKEETPSSPQITSSFHTVQTSATLADAHKFLPCHERCDITHSCSHSASPPPCLDLHNKIIPLNPSNEIRVTKGLPESQNSTTTHSSDHLHTPQADSSLPQVSSLSSSSSDAYSSAPATPSCTSSLFPNSGPSLLKLLSSTMLSPPLPYTLPLYSALFQHSLAPDPLLETYEIKRKVEKGLEESLRLVRHMIQQGSSSQSSVTASLREAKLTGNKEDVQENSQNLSIPALADYKDFKNFNQMSSNFSLQSTEVDNLDTHNFSKRCNEKNLHEDNSKSAHDKCFFKNFIGNRSKHTKKTRPKRRSKLKGTGKKRSHKEDHEHGERKRMKSCKKHKDNNTQSFPSTKEEGKDSVDILRKSLPVIHVRLVGSEFNIQNEGREYSVTIPGDCTSLDKKKECKQVSVDKYGLKNEKSGEMIESRVNLSPNQATECTHDRTVHRCKSKIHNVSDVSTSSCCSSSELSSQCKQEPLNFNCKCNLLTVGSLGQSYTAKPLQDGCCSRRQQKKESSSSGVQTQDAKAGLRELANFLDRSTSKENEAGNFDISNEIIDNLERNIKVVMRKNSMKMAIQSLLKKDAQRKPKVQLYREPKIAGENEVEVHADLHDMEREVRGCCFQEDGNSMSWRFHDLLSSDTGSSSDSDTSDGQLIIDTDG